MLDDGLPAVRDEHERDDRRDHHHSSGDQGGRLHAGDERLLRGAQRLAPPLEHLRGGGQRVLAARGRFARNVGRKLQVSPVEDGDDCLLYTSRCV